MSASLIAAVPSRAELRLIQDSLACENITVIHAASLEEALRYQAATPAGIVLYDMDALDPWTVALRHFLRLDAGTRVVFLSCLVDQRMWLDALDSGAYDLLVRPFQPVELHSIVRSALARINAPNGAGENRPTLPPRITPPDSATAVWRFSPRALRASF